MVSRPLPSTGIRLSIVLLIALVATRSNPVAHANPSNAVSQAHQPSKAEREQQDDHAALAQKNPSQAAGQPGVSASDRATASPSRGKGFTAAADSTPLIFLPVVNYPSGFPLYASSVAIGDVNGDGRPDLVVLNPRGGTDNDNGIVDVLLGNGDGTFQDPVLYSSGGYEAASLLIVDLNGDGHPDLVMSNQCQDDTNCAAGGAVSVMLNKGDGTFQTPVSYSSGGYLAQSVVVGDVNGDGKLDLVVVNTCQYSTNCQVGYGGGLIGVLLGNGNGTFQPVVTYDSGGEFAYFIAIGDLNHDGKLDLVVTNALQCFGCNSGGIVSVLLGNGNGTFEAPVVVYSLNQFPAYSVAIADVNGDGHPDLFVGLYVDGLAVLLGNGDGTFTSSGYSSGGDRVSSMVIGDVNGDGKADLVLVNSDSSSVGVLAGNGDGTFQPVTNYLSGGQGEANSVAVGDLNGDGKPDLAVANGGVGVLLNNNGAPPTTISLVSSAAPANVKQSVTYTATVANSSTGPLSGTVTFEDGPTPLAIVPLASNQATYTTSYKTAGIHAITGAYSGELHIALGSQSAILTEYVRSYNSTVALVTSGTPSLVGQPVTFTATVTSKAGTIPAGELVTFYDGTTALTSVALAGGKAAYTTSTLSVKGHSIKATYVGDNRFKPSTGEVVQRVELYSSTTTLSSIPNPSTHGQAVTLTATVTSSAPGGPTGQVIFKNGAASVGRAMLSAGKATFTTAKLPVGTLTITSNYNGDTHSAKSSGETTQMVQ